MEDKLVARLARLIQWWDKVLEIPHVRPVLQGFVFLSATSGAFWFLSRVFGVVALKIHSSLDYSLAVLFAVFYNIALAVAFSGVMAFSIFKRTAGTDDLLAYQAAGFVFIYLVLSAAYSDATGVVDEYALAGYVAGLASYLLFCVHTSFLNLPAVADAYKAVDWAMSPGPQRIIGSLGAAQGIVFALRGVRRRLFWRSVSVGGKRRFVF